MNDLTILTVAENDLGTLDLLLRSVFKFTKPKPEIIICDQGNNSVIDKYRANENITVVKNKPKLLGGSNRHGSGLSKIFPLVKTKRTAIVESDCILLDSSWNRIPSPYKMLAASKGKNLYHICFMVFYTDVLRDIDFRPGKKGNRSNRNYKPNEDVGHMVAKRIKSNEVYPVDFIDCKSGNGKFFGKQFQSDEFWVDGVPVVAHLGRGSNIAGKTIRKGFKHPRDQLIDWINIANQIIS